MTYQANNRVHVNRRKYGSDTGTVLEQRDRDVLVRRDAVPGDQWYKEHELEPVDTMGDWLCTLALDGPNT